MQVAWAKRYALDGLITLDRQDLLGRAPDVQHDLGGFRIFSPDEALAFVDRLHARYQIRNGGTST
jgi:hypothetical protein